jgi:Trk K+ transport system NAD-binding subunit
MIDSNASCVGLEVKDILWPNHFVIVSLRRGTQVLIPKGDTVLKAEDILTVVGEPGSILEARKLTNFS